MSKRNLINVTLLAITVLLVLIVVFEPGINEQQQQKISEIDTSTISQIRVKRLKQDDMLFEKQDNNWRMLEPYALPANDFKVQNLLRVLNTETHLQQPVAGLDLKLYGLDQPRAQIIFNASTKIAFGGTEPLQQRRYVLYNDHLNLITDVFYYQMGSPATSFIDGTLLPNNKEIISLKIPGYQFDKVDSRWSTNAADISADQINELIDNWKYTQSLETQLLTSKKQRPDIEVKYAGEEQAIQFIIVSNYPSLILGRPDIGIQYILGENKHQTLLQLPPKVELSEDELPKSEQPVSNEPTN